MNIKNKLAFFTMSLFLGFSLSSCGTMDSLNSFKHNLLQYENEVELESFTSRLNELKGNYKLDDYVLNTNSYDKVIASSNHDMSLINDGDTENKVKRVIKADLDNKLVSEKIDASTRILSKGPGFNQNGNGSQSLSLMLQKHKGEPALVVKSSSIYCPLNLDWDLLIKATDPINKMTSYTLLGEMDKYSYFIDGPSNNTLTIYYNQYSDQANSLVNENIWQIVFEDKRISLTTVSVLDQTKVDAVGSKMNYRSISCSHEALSLEEVELSAVDTVGFNKYNILNFPNIDFWRELL